MHHTILSIKERLTMIWLISGQGTSPDLLPRLAVCSWLLDGVMIFARSAIFMSCQIWTE